MMVVICDCLRLASRTARSLATRVKIEIQMTGSTRTRILFNIDSVDHPSRLVPRICRRVCSRGSIPALFLCAKRDQFFVDNFHLAVSLRGCRSLPAASRP